MPKKDEHIDWATHNRSFWTSIDLDNTPYTDWALTGMFYESVHWVEAFLASKGYHSGKHSERARYMALHSSDFGTIWKDYEQLRKDSRIARYDCYEYAVEQVRGLIPRVDRIKGHISQLL